MVDCSFYPRLDFAETRINITAGAPSTTRTRPAKKRPPTQGGADRGETMKSRTILPAMLACCGLALSGCDTFRGEELSLFDTAVTAEGVRSLVRGDGLEKEGNYFRLLRLEDLLDPESTYDDDDFKATRTNIKKAYKAFYSGYNPDDRIGSETIKLKRNRLQNRIIYESNQRCSVFKRFIKRVDAQTNLTLGILTTLSAGLGTIFTAANTVRAFSGAAAIFSGTRAEFDQVYFASATITIIGKGIDSRREKILANIVENQKQPIEIYTAEKAVADGISYHGSCTLIAGLEEAGKDLERVNNPGLKQIEATFKNFGKAKVAFEEAQKSGKRTGDDGGGNQGGSANSQSESSATPSERPPVEVAPLTR